MTITVVFRDPVEDDYPAKHTLTDREISPVTFPEVAIAVDDLSKGKRSS